MLKHVTNYKCLGVAITSDPLNKIIMDDFANTLPLLQFNAWLHGSRSFKLLVRDEVLTIAHAMFCMCTRTCHVFPLNVHSSQGRRKIIFTGPAC